MMKTITFSGAEAAWMAPLTEFCAEHGMQVLPEGGRRVTLCAGDCLAVCDDGTEVTITYRALHEIFRALTFLPQFPDGGGQIRETGRYGMLCFMGDCSRNAVYNLPTAKQMIRTLAGMGYSAMMLYTEDTYELPDYPYFGYMRGRYTTEELTELDAYAAAYGMELIPCIQALAHLTTAMRWPDFQGFRDTSDILMVGDERTYAFLRAALTQLKRCFRTRRFHLGMDEAHMLARGEYLKRNGYREPSEVMLEHLTRVMELCRELDIEPMIWSDMFFRMAHGGRYYIKEGWLPDEVVAKVPEGLGLIYWDYYSNDPALFTHMLDCHAQFNRPVIFAGGAWKWYGFGAHNAFSLRSSEMQLDLCEERGITNVIVTSWGDNGGEASQFSVLPTLLYFAERCYGATNRPSEEWMEARAQATVGESYRELLCFDLIDSLPETNADVTTRPRSPGKNLLYNDPFERLMDCHMNRETVTAAYAERAEKLMALAGSSRFGYAFETLGRLAEVLTAKATLGWRIYEAYRDGDRRALAAIVEELPALTAAIERFLAAYRKQWYRENKTFGFSAQEWRIGGLMARIQSVRLRLEGYLAGEIDRIEELESAPLSMTGGQEGEYLPHQYWSRIVAPGLL